MPRLKAWYQGSEAPAHLQLRHCPVNEYRRVRSTSRSTSRSRREEDVCVCVSHTNAPAHPGLSLREPRARRVRTCRMAERFQTSHLLTYKSSVHVSARVMLNLWAQTAHG